MSSISIDAFNNRFHLHLNTLFLITQDRMQLLKPQYANKVRNYLNEQFPGTWIDAGVAEWPARSPDLTPLDFFFWGMLKDGVYAYKINN